MLEIYANGHHKFLFSFMAEIHSKQLENNYQ